MDRWSSPTEQGKEKVERDVVRWVGSDLTGVNLYASSPLPARRTIDEIVLTGIEHSRIDEVMRRFLLRLLKLAELHYLGVLVWSAMDWETVYLQAHLSLHMRRVAAVEVDKGRVWLLVVLKGGRRCS